MSASSYIRKMQMLRIIADIPSSHKNLILFYAADRRSAVDQDGLKSLLQAEIAVAVDDVPQAMISLVLVCMRTPQLRELFLDAVAYVQEGEANGDFTNVG